MKKYLLACVLTLSVSANANAADWLDSLKNLVGLGDSAQEVKKEELKASTETAVTEATQAVNSLDIAGLVSSVSEKLNVSNDQAEGGMASLLNYAKANLADADYVELAKNLPGVDGLLSKVPDVSEVKSEGLGGLLNKASEYSDSLKNINALKQQFEALGLKPEMITQYISQAQSYLDTEQGQQAKALLVKGLSSFTGS